MEAREFWFMLTRELRLREEIGHRHTRGNCMGDWLTIPLLFCFRLFLRGLKGCKDVLLFIICCPLVAMAQESWKESEETVQTPEAPVLCVNNCGFFGNSMTNNMCSKCYRDFIKVTTMAVPVVEKKAFAAASSSMVPLEPAKEDEVPAAAVVDSQAAQEPPKPPSNRCLSCRKKVGLTGFQCRCGGTFCSMHRYADSHECSFDYKAAGREQIAKQNPVVIAEKVNKI